MRLVDLLPDLPDARVDGPADVQVERVTRDSRQAGPGVIFVAVPGATVDGHDFVPALGCAAVVVERDVAVRPGVARITVPSTRAALAHVAAALHGHPARAMPVVGVTGTNGKTTVTTLVEQAYAAGGVRTGRIGTTGVSIGLQDRPASFTTPEAPELQAELARMRDAGCALVAMEVSSIGLSQRRVDAIPFAVAVFTNLTLDHLDFHGTMAAYHDAKSRLFRELLRPPGGLPRALLCRDDPAHDTMGAPPDRWTYGLGVRGGDDVGIEVVGHDGDHTAVRVATPVGEVAMRTRLVGRHNLANLAAALGILLLRGVPAEHAARWVSEAGGAPGRLERVPDPSGRIVVVDYAHSDDALANVLPAARELSGGRLWVVFGCGGDRDRGKRPKMAAVAERLADRVVVTTDNPRSEDPDSIARDIVAGFARPGDVVVELDRDRAIGLAIAQARRGDVVVIAGKGHETYQEVRGVREPFDDRAVAARWLEES